MSKTIKALISTLALAVASTTFATTQELTDCAQLQDDKAVLLVHTSWCSHCVAFLPVYKAVSDAPEMSEYKFYTKQNDDFAPVCGKSVYGVPITFTHNMQDSLSGVISADALKTFIQK